MLVDTQIISEMYKAKHRAKVSFPSVVANEFLEVYGDSHSKPLFFLPLIDVQGSSRAIHRSMILGFHQQRPFSSRSSDRLVMSFNNEYPDIVEFGSRAIANAVNEKDLEVFRIATNGLPKQEQRRRLERFRYLASVEAECVPLSEPAVEIAFNLLFEFTKTNALKANFRNSLNDILILATAIRANDQLRTKDSLLARFAAKRYGASALPTAGDLIVDFSANPNSSHQKSKESKGYINRGWRLASEKAIKARR